MLNWSFVLENYVETQPSTDYASALLGFLLLSMMLLFASLLIIPLFTRPVNKIALSYNEKLWNDFINDNITVNDEVKRQLTSDDFKIYNGKLGVILIKMEGIEKAIEYYKASLHQLIATNLEKDTYKSKIITNSRNSITVIICYLNDRSYEACMMLSSKLADSIFNSIEPIYRKESYIAISKIKENLSSIPSLYDQCVEISDYRLTSGSHLLYYSMLDKKENSYEYQEHLEKQLLNNLNVGNLEVCKSILEEFFQSFENYNIKDSEIVNMVSRLTSSIIKNSTNDISAEIRNIENTIVAIISRMHTLDEMRAYISNELESIHTKVAERATDEISSSFDKMMAYIDNNFTNSDISVNNVVDELDLNRNFVSKEINEKTRGSFTDYVNRKRISYAKELLKDKSKTINDISEEIGFNYSYYFIKIFKSIEGITPGQYRSNLKE